MLQEYLKIMDVVKEYDSQLLTIKNWGVTLSLVAIGLGFKEKTWGYFLLAALSGVSFWVVEVARALNGRFSTIEKKEKQWAKLPRYF